MGYYRTYKQMKKKKQKILLNTYTIDLLLCLNSGLWVGIIVTLGFSLICAWGFTMLANINVSWSNNYDLFSYYSN